MEGDEKKEGRGPHGLRPFLFNNIVMSIMIVFNQDKNKFEIIANFNNGKSICVGMIGMGGRPMGDQYP